MTPARLGRLLGAAPVPRGSWAAEALLVSAAALGSPGGALAAAEEIATRLREDDGIAEVRVRPDGFLLIVPARPGEIVREIVERGPERAGAPGSPRVPAAAWPDFPRTWANPGFAVRFAHTRSVSAERWAADLGVPMGGFRPETLDHPAELGVLRLLAELPSRSAGRDPAWAAYVERLALAYHTAHEHAPAAPAGDGPPTALHTARVWLARAVRAVLVAIVGDGLPQRM
ncbi:anticodon-binding protein [Microbispora sp. RL4-1S]|uniref:Anticodon-binding protein n=1 Tax=Microbispora oryzae TaxID=2806554 RepID=A0A941AIH6_9ACTN|nr:anticodon-binding protein [Microbispora oryzae]MBP2705176.1 anticodon-binding protein [Microbispora oryzae]